MNETNESPVANIRVMGNKENAEKKESGSKKSLHDEKVEQILESICRKFSELDDVINAFEGQIAERKDEDDDFIKKFTTFYNSLSEKTSEVLSRLDKEVKFRDNLQAQLDLKKSELECIELKQALEGYHAKFDQEVSSIKKSITEGIEKLNKQETTFIEAVSNKIREIEPVNIKFEEYIVKFQETMREASSTELIAFEEKCKKSLQKCNDSLNQIKNESINFLTQCQKQNETLINKIPVQKEEFSKKDLVIYILCGCNVIGIIVQILVAYFLR